MSRTEACREKSSKVWNFLDGNVPRFGTFGKGPGMIPGEPRTWFARAKKSGGPASEEGAALIVAVWVILIMTLLISSMAFDMQVEANVAAFQRKRVQAQYLARAGMEWSLAALNRKVTENQDEELVLEPGQDEQLVVASINLSRGVGISGVTTELGSGRFIVDILPEESRRNVNVLTEEDWKEILDQAGVENTRWPELIDCFLDWIDEGDAHRLHGAESDDPFYKERGYEVKNAPLDTVDELLLIKGFDENLLYGGPSPQDASVMYRGIAGWLTTWGDGKVNVNTASREVLMTLPEIEEYVIDAILEYRTGVDGIPNTKDDGFRDVDEVITKTGLDPQLRDLITTTERKYLRVVSIGEVDGVRNGIWAVLQAGEGGVLPVYWREEAMP
ncbi:MAG TPA: type II secretion system protein GspK [Kiritimatiellia bacterium]|nr:type II secretion system protein GspK [Kiritimatiellia bacterium]HMO98197.1 type II secretion system protein GspK [Kiritimatiellia bacterium]HMP96485.1 type II secretion system protein GspK [Kiritimatiellia bacterium]